MAASEYCLDTHKTQEMCNKTVDTSLPALKFVPDQFVTYKMLQQVENVAFSDDDDDDDDDIGLDDIGYDTVIFQR